MAQTIWLKNKISDITVLWLKLKAKVPELFQNEKKVIRSLKANFFGKMKTAVIEVMRLGEYLSMYHFVNLHYMPITTHCST